MTCAKPSLHMQEGKSAGGSTQKKEQQNSRKRAGKEEGDKKWENGKGVGKKTNAPFASTGGRTGEGE